MNYTVISVIADHTALYLASSRWVVLKENKEKRAFAYSTTTNDTTKEKINETDDKENKKIVKKYNKKKSNIRQINSYKT